MKILKILWIYIFKGILKKGLKKIFFVVLQGPYTDNKEISIQIPFKVDIQHCCVRDQKRWSFQIDTEMTVTERWK